MIAIPNLLKKNSCESACDVTMSHVARKIVRQFMDSRTVCGSISVACADDRLLVETGLTVARQLQDQLQLQVGWWSHHPTRLGQIFQKNHFGGFDADIHPLTTASTRSTPVDLLVIDNLEQFDLDSLHQMDQKIDAQIVLGLSATPLPAEILECFDHNTAVEFAYDHSVDLPQISHELTELG